MTSRVAFSGLALVLACGCGSGSGAASDPGPSGPSPTDLSGLNETQREQVQQLKTELVAGRALDAQGLLQKRALNQLPQLSYDPRSSQFMDRVQASTLALTEDELERLGANGFVISERSAFPTFVRGYAAVYYEHLPVYVSADAILEAIHSSYDTALADVERDALSALVGGMLGSMHENLVALADEAPESAADLDVYLSVARSLLSGSEVAPVAGGDVALTHELYELALEGSGERSVSLFGVQRDIDASQFTPRGHYANDPQLTNYFRAMMWLGRTDFRLVDTKPDGSQAFVRRQYDAMLLLRRTLSDEARAAFQKVDAVLAAFLGESGYMTVPQVDALVADLGGMSAARSASDAIVEAALRTGGYGIQRIASQIMVNAGVVETLPLARSFALFGQRYVLDSHVFSQVVYDRVPSKRMMPSPLDVAYAALGNNQALSLLGGELSRFAGYPGALEGARVLSDAHGDEFWNANLYNLWLSSLRTLSPASDTSRPASSGMPEITGTPAWGLRMLNTQLGSWAELRHDTLLYSMQSYTGIPSCDYPDAYVDPYPEFYGKLQQFAERGEELAGLLESELSLSSVGLRRYFTSLGQTLRMLGGMAKNQREGTPFTTEQMAFVNRAVRVVKQDVTCTTVDAPDGWLADLYLERRKAIQASPTIADVHTQPADEFGNTVGNVLHVGLGYPRLMVTTVDTCQGPRAYVGVAFAYHEHVTKGFVRLNDETWKSELVKHPPNVPWLSPVIGH